MTLSLAERDVLKSAVKGFPFDVDTRDAEYTEAVTKGEISSRPAKTEIVSQWESRPVEIVIIGDPTPVLDLYDGRTKNLNVYLLGFPDKQTAKAYQISVAQRGAPGSFTVMTKTNPLQAAETYVGHVRPGHGEIDGLILGAHVDQLFELTMCPIPALLDAWFPKIGLGGQLVVGGMNLKVVQEAIAAYVADGRLAAVSEAGNCWMGTKANWEAVEAKQDEPVKEGTSAPEPSRNPLMRMFGR